MPCGDAKDNCCYMYQCLGPFTGASPDTDKIELCVKYDQIEDGKAKNDEYTPTTGTYKDIKLTIADGATATMSKNKGGDTF